MSSYQAVQSAISQRIMTSGLNLITTYGLPAVMEQIDATASRFDSFQLDEIGTSDVSCWVREIESALQRYHTPVNPQTTVAQEYGGNGADAVV